MDINSVIERAFNERADACELARLALGFPLNILFRRDDAVGIAAYKALKEFELQLRDEEYFWRLQSKITRV
ncbi:MAG: hypothetical protein ACI3XY_02590 [Butyricicoccaceae bacterium]